MTSVKAEGEKWRDTSLWLQGPSGAAAAEDEVIGTGFQGHRA